MRRFECPYLNGQVEMTEERERHILENHPDLLPEFRDQIAQTLRTPDEVRRSARLFSRWFEAVRRGKHVVVVVVSDPGPSARHWIVTAYMARKLVEGDVEWKRS